MKILMLGPNQIHRYNWGHQLFRNEIGKQHDVLYYGERYPKFNKSWNVQQIMKQMNFDPDIIMTYGWRYSQDFKGLGKIKSIPKVHVTVDYAKPQGIITQNEFFKKNKYDLIFAITKRAQDLQIENNVAPVVELLPFSVDTNIYRPLKLKKEKIVLAAFATRSDVYPNRIKAIKTLKKAGIRLMQKRVTQRKLVNWINRAKVTITCNNIYNSLSLRYTETLSCGGFLLADKPDDFDLLGFKEGEHLVIYNNLEDLKKKVIYYLDEKNEKERQQIATQGMNFVRKNHSCKKRVKQMTEIIGRVIK